MSTPVLCPVCGASPCYLICPTQDPYAGRPWEEHEDHEAGANRYDGFEDSDTSHLDDNESDAPPAGAPEKESAAAPVESDPDDILF